MSAAPVRQLGILFKLRLVSSEVLKAVWVVYVFFQQLAKGITLMLDRVDLQGLDEFFGGLAERLTWRRLYGLIENTR